jgi:hypothetical protein
MALSSSRFTKTINGKDNKTPTPSEYDIIIRGAKYQNHAAINSVLSKVSINLRDTGNVPPISRLAENGDIDAVRFLKKYYHVSESWAAQGYAKALNFSALNNLISEYPARKNYIFAEAAVGFGLSSQPYHSVNLIENNPEIAGMLNFYFAMGLGESGHATNINNYLTDKSFAYIQMIGLAYGLGLGNHEDLFKKMLDQKPQLKTLLLSNFMPALGVGGHITTILKILKKHPELLFTLVPATIEGLARSHQLVSIEKIIKLYPIRQRDIIKCKLSGLAAGGYVKKADNMLNNHVELDVELKGLIIQKYANHHHLTDALYMMNKFPNQCLSAVTGFAAIGLVNEVNGIINSNPNHLLPILAEAVESYSFAGNFNEADELINSYPLYRYELLKAKLRGVIDGSYLETGKNLYIALTIEFVDDVNFAILVTENLACLGYTNELIDFLLECKDAELRLDLAVIAVKVFIRNYLFDEARVFLESVNDHEDIILKAMAEELSSLFVNEEETLLLLSTIPDKTFREELVKAHDKSNITQNISRLLPKAEKISQVMFKYDLNYQQALGWIKPEVQFWLLKDRLLMHKHPMAAPILVLITSFLVKNEVDDLKDLQVKLKNRFFVPKRPPLANITNKSNINLLTKDRKSYDLRKMR